MASSSPTSRTLAFLRAEGYEAEITEHYNAFSKKRHDLFNCIDVLGIKEGQILGVQCTTDSNVSARLEKIKGISQVVVWLKAGGLLEVWGWAKKGPRGEMKRWKVRRIVVTLDMLAS